MPSPTCPPPAVGPADLAGGNLARRDLAGPDETPRASAIAWDDVPPTDEELRGLVPDPECDPPDGMDAWLTDISACLRHESSRSTDPDPVPEALPAGRLPRDCGDGAGFAAGGVTDRMPPGMVLAGFASDIWMAGLGRINDDQLIGVLLAWRRLSSWTAGGELAAVAELNRRRIADAEAGGDAHLAEHVADELAVPLTLTARGADQLLDFACRLGRLPRTSAALAAGDIDRIKALVITDEVSCLDGDQAAAVEAAVIGRAPGQTTGQLRAAIRRAVFTADPAAARKQRERAAKEARVEVWSEHSGTAALAGRDLPPADVLAADRRIDALARQLKAAGIPGSLDQLRARAYTALLLGRPMPGLAQPGPSGMFAPPMAGAVSLTMPLATWLGASSAPGEVAGFGPVTAGDGRALADHLAGEPGSRWCLTLTGADGTATAHGCARMRWDAGTGCGTDTKVSARGGRSAAPGAGRSPSRSGPWPPGAAATNGSPPVTGPRPHCAI